MATRAVDDSLYASFGVMGGYMQPQGHLQVVAGLVDDGLNPQAALDRLRFCIEPEQGEGNDAQVSLENGFPAETLAGLEARGHSIRLRPPRCGARRLPRRRWPSALTQPLGL